jgi:hypothetical protein
MFVGSSVTDLMFLSAENRAMWMFASFLVEQLLEDAVGQTRADLARNVTNEFRKRETLIFAQCAANRSGPGALATMLPPGVAAQMWHRASDQAAQRLFALLAPIGAENPYRTRPDQPAPQPPAADDAG